MCDEYGMTVRGSLDPPGKKQPFMAFSNYIVLKIKYFYFNVMGLGIDKLYTI